MSRGGFLRRFPVLGIRDFRLLLADRLIAPASVGFSIVGVSFAVLSITGSATDLSYVLAAQIAPSLVFALLGGVAADRFPPQRVIVAANLLMALGEGTFGVLVLTGNPPLWAMIGLEAVTGTGVAVFYPASQALLPRLVPSEKLQEASAISRLVMNIGQMSGAAVAGLLVAAAGELVALSTAKDTPTRENPTDAGAISRSASSSRKSRIPSTGNRRRNPPRDIGPILSGSVGRPRPAIRR